MNKRAVSICALLLLALLPLSCKETERGQAVQDTIPESGEPGILDGAKYVGRMELADPFIFVDRTDSLYYLFGTGSADKGFKAYISRDLQRWIQADGKAAERFALHKNDVTVVSDGITYSDNNFWAPELYKVGDRRYLMFYTASEHIYVAEADSPCGPFRQRSTGFAPSACSIDNTLFIDDDGRAYMYWVLFDWGNVIYAAELEPSLDAIKEGTLAFCFRATQDWELVMESVNEGPGVFKHNGLYYMVYSGNHYYSQDYGVGVATATSPLGPWTKYPDNPILCKPGSLVGTGHCSVFTDLEGNLKMVFHAHYSDSRINPRQTYITDLSFERVDGVDKLVASPSYSGCYLYRK